MCCRQCLSHCHYICLWTTDLRSSWIECLGFWVQETNPRNLLALKICFGLQVQVFHPRAPKMYVFKVYMIKVLISTNQVVVGDMYQENLSQALHTSIIVWHSHPLICGLSTGIVRNKYWRDIRPFNSFTYFVVVFTLWFGICDQNHSSAFYDVQWIPWVVLGSKKACQLMSY